MKKTLAYHKRVDRRTTIKWLAATMAAANTGCATGTRFMGEEIPPATAAGAAPHSSPGATGVTGYGTDPDLLNPEVPWPKRMTPEQLELTATLCDLILPEDNRSPAASAVGVPDFIDEWVSAPYQQQRADRDQIFAGLDWLDARSIDQFGKPFSAIENRLAVSMLETVVSKENTQIPASITPFFERFRYLAVGAFYTTDAGSSDIGYLGNVPITGDYPGPSAEAMAHLDVVLDQLGLSLPAQ